MPEWYKKRILQRPGQETQLITERPSEFYQLELPDFRIPTVTNSEDSVMTGLENRKGRDAYNQAYNEYLEQHPISPLSGVGYNPYIGIQYNPQVKQQQAAHDYAVKKSGYIGDKSTSPYKNVDDAFGAVSAIGVSMIPLLGASYGTFGVLPRLAADTYFGYEGARDLVSPEGVAKTVNFAKQGRNGRAILSGIGDLFDLTLARQGLKGIKTLSAFAKETPYIAKFNWMNRKGSFRMDYPWQRTPETLPERLTLEHIAENQTPKYNPNQLRGLNKQPYQSPSASQLETIPQAGFMSNIRYGYSLPNATKGNLKQIDNFIENDIFPRMQAAGHNIEYGKITMPTLRQFDPKNDLVDRYISINGNKNASAWFSPTDNTVTYRGTSPEEADYSKAIHEIGGHGVRRNINPDYKPTTREKLNELLRLNESALYSKNIELPDINIADEVYLPQEEILLNTSYEPFFKGGDGEGNIKEYDAVNKQLRARISQMNGHKVGNDLDPIIDKFSDARLLSLLRDLPYTQNGTLKLLSNITGIDEDTLMFASDLELNRLTNKYPDISRLLKRIKDTMKYVGGISAVGIGMNNIPQKQE